MMLRCRKIFVLFLLLLNTSGARIVSVTDVCERSRVFFSPARSLRAIVKLVRGQERTRRPPRSFGAQRNRYASLDVERLCRDDRPAMVSILPPVSIALHAESSRLRPVHARHAPRDRSPTGPPLLI
jgi:hypothetical protein